MSIKMFNYYCLLMWRLSRSGLLGSVVNMVVQYRHVGFLVGDYVQRFSFRPSMVPSPGSDLKGFFKSMHRPGDASWRKRNCGIAGRRIIIFYSHDPIFIFLPTSGADEIKSKRIYWRCQMRPPSSKK